MNTQRITMITLAVSDLEISRAFYADLGWVEAKGGNEKIAFYTLHGQFLSLYLREALEVDLGKSIVKNATGAVTLATNYGSKEQVDQAFQTAIAAKAVVMSAPEEVFWGGYSALVADPDGHLWEYAFNPFWELDADGQLVDPSKA